LPLAATHEIVSNTLILNGTQHWLKTQLLLFWICVDVRVLLVLQEVAALAEHVKDTISGNLSSIAKQVQSTNTFVDV